MSDTTTGATMDKWEYNTLYFTLNSNQVWEAATGTGDKVTAGLYNCLDAVGANGWELVNTVVAEYANESREDLQGTHGNLRAVRMIALFKRPK